MRRSFENSLLEIIRAVVIDRDSVRAAEILNTVKASSDSECQALYSFAKR